MRFEPIWRDFVFATRTLRRSYGFAAVAVVTIAVGVGATTALFSIVRGALLERWPYTGYDRIVSLRANSPRLTRTAFPLWSAAEYRDLVERRDLFDAVIAGEGRGVTFGTAPSVERVAAAVMTANTWAMLGVPPLLGRTFDASDDRPGGPHVAVASYRFWRNRLGGRASVIGSVVQIDQTPFTVIGVMPPEFVWWDRDLWLPLQLDPRDRARDDRRWYVQARVRSGVVIAQAQAALGTTASAWHDEYRSPEYDNLTIQLAPLVAETLRDARQVLYLLLGAVALVLVVASANVATLLLIRGVRRRGELAVKLALGAGRGRLVRQLLTENVLVALAAALAGLWLAGLLLQPLVSLIPFGIPAEAHIAIDWRAAAFAVAAAVISGGVFGIVPALRAVDGHVADDLKTASRRSAGGGSRALDAFMAAQFALALIVLSATLVVVRGFERTLAANSGYVDADVLTFRVAFAHASPAPRNADVLSAILRSVAAVPDVRAVAATTSLPIGAGPRASFSPGRDPTQLDANVDSITPGYFQAMGTPVVAGRDFTAADDLPRARVAIVNEAAAERLWPRGSAVGMRLLWRERAGEAVELTVVGVAGDMKREALRPAAPAVFVPIAQEPAPAAIIVLRTAGADEGLFAAARSAVTSAAPDVPAYAPRTLTSLRTDALGSERLAAVLLTAFAAVGLLLSIVGMYGVTRYTVEQRTGELAVRAALGASRRHLLALVLSRSVIVLLVGAGAGAFGSWMAIRIVAASIEGTGGSGALAFGGAAVPLVVSALIAAYVPGRRAASISPAEALKSS